MNTQEKYTISEATALLGFKSRSTINKRTKSQGNDAISCDTDEKGNKVISHIELQRAFPDKFKEVLKKNKDTANTSAEYSTKAQSNTANTEVLQHKVDTLEELLEVEKTERLRERQEFKERETKAEVREADYRDHVSKLVKTVSEQTKLLEYKAEEKAETQQADLKPVQANENFSGSESRGDQEKALQGKISAGYGAIILGVVVLGLSVTVINLDKVIEVAENQGWIEVAEIEDLNAIAPAAGVEKEKEGQGVDIPDFRIYDNRNFTPAPEFSE